MQSALDRKNIVTAPEGWLKGTAGISQYAGVSTRTASSWLRDGLPAKRITARLLLVRPADVDSYIEERATERASQRGEVLA
jgi:hypothetical protein